MTLQVPAVPGSATPVAVSENVFGQPYNETLIHQLVVKYLAAGRAGTKAQKNRASVSGGGAKPWRQKGTGRARSGTSRGPIWRSGGVTFAAQPRSFEQKLNKKMYRAGIRSIFSELLRQDRLVVSDDLNPSTPKTKELNAKVQKISSGKILLVVDEISQNLMLASSNVPYLAIATPSSVDPVSLVYADKVVVSSQALKQIEEQYS